MPSWKVWFTPGWFLCMLGNGAYNVRLPDTALRFNCGIQIKTDEQSSSTNVSRDAGLAWIYPPVGYRLISDVTVWR